MGLKASVVHVFGDDPLGLSQKRSFASGGIDMMRSILSLDVQRTSIFQMPNRHGLTSFLLHNPAAA